MSEAYELPYFDLLAALEHSGVHVEELGEKFGRENVIKAANARCITSSREGDFATLRTHGRELLAVGRRLLEMRDERNTTESVSEPELKIQAVKSEVVFESHSKTIVQGETMSGKERILQYLEDFPVPHGVLVISQKTGLTYQQALILLKGLHVDGLVLRKGLGGRHQPYQYQIATKQETEALNIDAPLAASITTQETETAQPHERIVEKPRSDISDELFTLEIAYKTLKPLSKAQQKRALTYLIEVFDLNGAI
jgi:hypothetical protein